MQLACSGIEKSNARVYMIDPSTNLEENGAVRKGRYSAVVPWARHRMNTILKFTPYPRIQLLILDRPYVEHPRP